MTERAKTPLERLQASDLDLAEATVNVVRHLSHHIDKAWKALQLSQEIESAAEAAGAVRLPALENTIRTALTEQYVVAISNLLTDRPGAISLELLFDIAEQHAEVFYGAAPEAVRAAVTRYRTRLNEFAEDRMMLVTESNKVTGVAELDRIADSSYMWELRRTTLPDAEGLIALIFEIVTLFGSYLIVRDDFAPRCQPGLEGFCDRKMQLGPARCPGY